MNEELISIRNEIHGRLSKMDYDQDENIKTIEKLKILVEKRAKKIENYKKILEGLK